MRVPTTKSIALVTWCSSIQEENIQMNPPITISQHLCQLLRSKSDLIRLVCVKKNLLNKKKKKNYSCSVVKDKEITISLADNYFKTVSD